MPDSAASSDDVAPDAPAVVDLPPVQAKWAVMARAAMLGEGSAGVAPLQPPLSPHDVAAYRRDHRRLAADIRRFRALCERKVEQVVQRAEYTVSMADSFALSSDADRRRSERELILEELDIDAVRDELEALVALFDQLR